ncbi:MAG: repair protein RadC, partial [Deltaproteobacteria bacterium]|nr:repair protein RadC [Deltaproteobacteria bacterium]
MDLQTAYRKLQVLELAILGIPHTGCSGLHKEAVEGLTNMVTEIDHILRHEIYEDQDVWCLTCGNEVEAKSKEKQAVRSGGLASAEAPATEGQIRCSEDVYQALREEAANLDKECFWMVPLTAKNQIIEIKLVSMGSLTSSIVHPREAFKPAILASAAAIIRVH